MASPGKAYFSLRLAGTVGFVVLALIAGVARSIFGDGTVHVIADGPVELLVDGKSIEVESISDWHRRASIPTGKHTVVLRAEREERAFELEASGHSVHLLPLKDQCFVWTTFTPRGRVYEPQVMQRFKANSPPIAIPDGTLFGAEADSISAPPPAIFGTIDCDSIETVSDQAILGDPGRIRLQCTSGGIVRDFDSKCVPTDPLSLVVPEKKGGYAAVTLQLDDASLHVLVFGEAGNRNADAIHPIVLRDADGKSRLLAGATVIVLLADGAIPEPRALQSGAGGGSGAAPLERVVLPITYQ